MSDYNIEIIYSSWSSVILPEAAYLKNSFPGLRWVHRYLMYPASLSAVKSIVKNVSVWRYIRYADKVIVHTEAIKNYMSQRVCSTLGAATVMLEKLNEKYFCDDVKVEKYSCNDNRFHLVFLGSITDSVYGRRLLRYLRALPKRIIIHIAETDWVNQEIRRGAENIRAFKRRPVGRELTCYIKRFDGVLALYAEGASRSPRVNNVMPNRIILALPARVPIYIPEVQLGGALSELEPAGVLETFKSGEHLIRRLEEKDGQANRDVGVDQKDLVLGEEFVNHLVSAS